MQLPVFDLLPQSDVDRPFLPTADPRETPTHIAQDHARVRALQDAIALGLDPSLHARPLHQDEYAEEGEVVVAEQARLGMVAGEEEVPVIAATAVMMTEAGAEVGDTEVVEDVKWTIN